MPQRRDSSLLNRHDAELSALHEIAVTLARHTGLRETIQRTLESLTQRLGMARATVMLDSAAGGELVVETEGALGGRTPWRGPGIEERVFETGQAAVVCGRPTASGESFSSVCVPIVLGHEVIGTLCVDVAGRESGELERDKKVLGVVAGLIAGEVRHRHSARLEREALELENQRLLDTLREQYRPEGIVGNSRAMREVCARIRQLAESEIPLLLRGEAGTGKEMLATAVHYASPRAAGPLVRLSCTGLGAGLLESELFGQDRRPYAGGPPRRVRIEEAEGGTLFLDEIGDFTPALQVKLLRLIQDHVYERAGGGVTRQANVRIITATTRDLERAVEEGRFRQDLYYRLNVFPIVLPALRDRREDVPALANTFVARYAEAAGKTVRRISTAAVEMLMAYSWPGNVRELESCIEHAVQNSTDEVIHGHDLPPTLQAPNGSDAEGRATLKQQIHAVERDAIVDSLKRAGGSINVASRELGITGRMVRYKIKQLEIDYRGMFARRRRA